MFTIHHKLPLQSETGEQPERPSATETADPTRHKYFLTQGCVSFKMNEIAFQIKTTEKKKRFLKSDRLIISCDVRDHT